MYPLGIIIIMSYTYRPMYLGANQKLFLKEKTKKLWKISFVAGIGNLLLNLLLIPIFGYQAAAFTTWVALMYMGFSGFYTKESKELRTVNFYHLRWLGSIILLTSISYLLVELPWWWKAVISLITITAASMALWNLSKRVK